MDMEMVASVPLWIYYSVCCLIACWTFAIGTMRPPLLQRMHWCYNGLCLRLLQTRTTPMPNEPNRNRFIVHFFLSSIFFLLFGFLLPTSQNDFILFMPLHFSTLLLNIFTTLKAMMASHVRDDKRSRWVKCDYCCDYDLPAFTKRY